MLQTQAKPKHNSRALHMAFDLWGMGICVFHAEEFPNLTKKAREMLMDTMSQVEKDLLKLTTTCAECGVEPEDKNMTGWFFFTHKGWYCPKHNP